MATCILTKSKGSTYHPKGNTLIPRQLAYRIAGADYFAIRRLAPTWETGPCASHIASAEIEQQRQAFIQMNGCDGLYSTTPEKEIV